MKPIESGCLVLILQARMVEFVGRTGVVIKRDDGTPYLSKATGQIKSAPGNWVVHVPGYDYPFTAPGRWLLRIDDYEVAQGAAKRTLEHTV